MVRGYNLCSDAFGFEVQYALHSNACETICYVVDEVIVADNGHNPSTPSSPSSLSEFSGFPSYCSLSGEEESVPHVQIDCEVKTSELKVTNDSSPVRVMVRSKQMMRKERGDCCRQGTPTSFAGKAGGKAGKHLAAKQNLNPDDNKNNDMVNQALPVGSVCHRSCYLCSIKPQHLGLGSIVTNQGPYGDRHITNVIWNVAVLRYAVPDCFMGYPMKLRKIFTDSLHCVLEAICSRHITVMPKDIYIAGRIRGENCGLGLYRMSTHDELKQHETDVTEEY